MLRRLGTTAVACVLIANSATAAQEVENRQVNNLGEPSGALSTEDTRLTVGAESLSTSATSSNQHLLIDFMLTAPLSGPDITRSSKPWVAAWLNARFNGVAATSLSGVKQFVGGFEKDLVAGDTSRLLNVLAFRAGAEVKIPGMNGATFGGDFQFQPLFIGSIGIQTVPPLSSPSIFNISDEARQRWGITNTAIQYVALTEPDRRRFYRTFELGLRLKTHHFFSCTVGEPENCDRRRNFPGIVDLTLGQDPYITGGVTRGLVGRIDAFYPLPTDNLANAIYLFGAVRVHWLKDLPAEQDPIILRAPTATVIVPGPTVFVHTLTTDERTRDEWKFGLGMDLVRLFSAATNARNEDRAAEVIEDGSRVRLNDEDDAEVSIYRRLIQKNGEIVTFNHTVDMVIPLQTASLQATLIPSGGTGTIDFVKDEVRIERGIKRRLKNTGSENFELIQVRLKDGDAQDTFKEFSFDKEKKHVTEKILWKDDARYQISKIQCDAMCDLKSGDDVNNLIIIVPLAKATVVVGGKASDLQPYQPLRINRKTAFELKSAADLAVLRIR